MPFHPSIGPIIIRFVVPPVGIGFVGLANPTPGRRGVYRSRIQQPTQQRDVLADELLLE